MDRVTLRFSDELSTAISRHASEAGISRARWVREMIVARVAYLEGFGDSRELTTRLQRLEDHLRLHGARGLP
jgi:predicted DNA-binding protein